MYLIAGLGNKGKKYNNTRHNVGFLIIDKLISQYSLEKYKDNFDSEVYKGMILKKKVIAIKPMTFVNNSGKAVKKIVSFYKIPLKKVFVFHDDMDLNLSKIKVKLGGSSAGHNGIKSIDMNIGKKYFRLRVGIGKPIEKLPITDYVLEEFNSNEYKTINRKVDCVVENINYLLNYEIDNFLNKLSTI
tara:strand:+ start:84 stop:644 length:561 start_codon:yes stop_codon:yes gene_type:complete